MSFLSILFALLLEQARPLVHGNPVHLAVRAWIRWVIRSFDAGKQQHAWLAWCFAVVLPAVVAFVVHWALVWGMGWIAATVWSIVVLYITLGFRQFSHHFTGIRDALLAGEEDVARQKLAQWIHADASTLPRSELLALVISHSVRNAHRHVFGVFAWYSLLAAMGLGPSGAVLYRMAGYFVRYADRPENPLVLPLSEPLQAAVRYAWYLMDWVPVRITALGFAFVGSFEDAIDAWRQQEAQFPDDNDGVMLAATAGALNVELKCGDGSRSGGGDSESAQTPQTHHLRSVVGLVWRTVVMWMVFLALLSLARLAG